MLKATSVSTTSDRKIAIVISLLLLATYLATSAVRFKSVDGLAVYSVSRSLIGHGAMDSDILYWLMVPMGRGSVIATGLDGHSYSVKDIGLSLLALPAVWLANQNGLSPVRLALLISPVLTAAAGTVLFLLIRSWGYSQRTAGLGSLLFGLGSMAWPYAETFYTQPAAAFGLLVALYGSWQTYLRRSPKMALIGGIGLGISGLNSSLAWLSGPFYLLFLLNRALPQRETLRTRLAQAVPLILVFCAGAAPFALGQAAYNTFRFGGPLSTGHNLLRPDSFALANMMPGSLGMLISTSRGVIWYAPFCLLAPLGARIAFRSGRFRLWLLAAAQASCLLIFSSIYEEWWGGLAWGPRFLVAIMPALTLLVVPYLDAVLQRKTQGVASAGVIAMISLSLLTQLGAATLNDIVLEGEIYGTYRALGFPQKLGALRSLYLDPVWLPQIRLLRTMSLGNWDMWYLAREGVTRPAITVQFIAMLLGISLLWLLIRRRSLRFSGLGIVIQSMIVIAIAILLIQRDTTKIKAPDSLPTLISQLRAKSQARDCVVTLLPERYERWMEGYDSRLPDIGMMYQEHLDSRTEAMLGRTGIWCGRVWVVSEGTVSGNWANGVERWLASHGFVGTEYWFDDWRLISYSYQVGEPELVPIGQTFGEGAVELVAGASSVGPSEGVAWINVWLQWRAAHPMPEDYSVFVHVVDENGTLVAQHDGQPDAGFAPTSSWAPATPVDDRHQVVLPQNLPPGEYDIMVGLYDWKSGHQLVLANGASRAWVGTVHIGGR